MGLELKESGQSNSSNSIYDSIAYNPVKDRLSESEAEAEEPTSHNINAQDQIL